MESLKKVKTVLSSQALQKREESYVGCSGHSLSIPGSEGWGWDRNVVDGPWTA